MQIWPWALFWGRGSWENDGRAMWRINLAQLEKLWLRTKTTDNSRDWPAAASTALYTGTTKHKTQRAKVRSVKVHTHIVQLSMCGIPEMLWNHSAKSVLKVGTTSSGYTCIMESTIKLTPFLYIALFLCSMRRSILWRCGWTTVNWAREWVVKTWLLHTVLPILNELGTACTWILAFIVDCMMHV